MQVLGAVGKSEHSGTTLFGLNYSYGPAATNNGEIQKITDTIDNGRTVTYGYDALYRLSTAVTAGSAGYPAWGLSWTYDRYANRTAQTITAGTGLPSNSVSVNAATNRITTAGYADDANGNMTNDGYNTLVYDGENHALSATNRGAAGSYTYDGNGNRIKKVSGSTTTVYIFSGSKVIDEYDNGAAPASPSREYYYDANRLLAKYDPTYGGSYYQQDLVSNRLVTNDVAAVIEQLGHYPYGESWYNATNDKLMFTTYERDAESGNDYAMSRSYTSRLARFLSPDPAGRAVADPRNPQSWNRYTYALNNPLKLIDPRGLDPCDEQSAIAPARGRHRLHAFDDPACGEDSTGGSGGDGGGGVPLAGPTDYGNYCTYDCTAAGPGNLGYIDNSPFLDGTMIDSYGNVAPCCQNWSFDNGPSFADEQLQGIAPGIVQGAGSIGDASTYLIWMGVAAGSAAIPFAPELYEIGASAATNFSGNLLTWQALDPVGFGEATDIISNFLPTPPGIAATGSGALMGVLAGQLCDTTVLVTTGSCQ